MTVVLTYVLSRLIINSRFLVLLLSGMSHITYESFIWQYVRQEWPFGRLWSWFVVHSKGSCGSGFPVCLFNCTRYKNLIVIYHFTKETYLSNIMRTIKWTIFTRSFRNNELVIKIQRQTFHAQSWRDYQYYRKKGLDGTDNGATVTRKGSDG